MPRPEKIEMIKQRLRNVEEENACLREIIASMTCMPPTVDRELIDAGVALSMREHRALSYLLHNEGEIRSDEQIFSAIYFDKIGDLPDLGMVKQYVMRMRRKLVAAGSSMEIEAFHGRGYRVIRREKVSG